MRKKRHLKKVSEGVVVSNKMDKTIVVRIDRLTKHKKYKRVIRAAAKFKVDDPKNQAKLGNKVRIMECRPISKEKRWRLLEVLK